MIWPVQRRNSSKAWQITVVDKMRMVDREQGGEDDSHIEEPEMVHGIE